MILVKVREPVIHKNIANEVVTKAEFKSTFAGTLRINPNLISTSLVLLKVVLKLMTCRVVDDMFRYLKYPKNDLIRIQKFLSQ